MRRRRRWLYSCYYNFYVPFPSITARYRYITFIDTYFFWCWCFPFFCAWFIYWTYKSKWNTELKRRCWVERFAENFSLTQIYMTWHVTCHVFTCHFYWSWFFSSHLHCYMSFLLELIFSSLSVWFLSFYWTYKENEGNIPDREMAIILHTCLTAN